MLLLGKSSQGGKEPKGRHADIKLGLRLLRLLILLVLLLILLVLLRLLLMYRCCWVEQGLAGWCQCRPRPPSCRLQRCLCLRCKICSRHAGCCPVSDRRPSLLPLLLRLPLQQSGRRLRAAVGRFHALGSRLCALILQSPSDGGGGWQRWEA